MVVAFVQASWVTDTGGCANCSVGLKERSSCLVVAGDPSNKCTNCARSKVVCDDTETTSERRARMRAEAESRALQFPNMRKRKRESGEDSEGDEEGDEVRRLRQSPRRGGCVGRERAEGSGSRAMVGATAADLERVERKLAKIEAMLAEVLVRVRGTELEYDEGEKDVEMEEDQ